MERHATLVDTEAVAINIVDEYRFRAIAYKEFEQAARRRERDMLEDVKSWLAPKSFDDDRERCQDIIEDYPNTGNWLVHDTRFNSWLEDSSKPVLFLSGIPGSGKCNLLAHSFTSSPASRVHANFLKGKTVLSYIIWNNLFEESQKGTTASFVLFLNDRNRIQYSLLPILQTIIYHILLADGSLLPLFDELRNSFGKGDIKTRRSMGELIGRLLEATELSRICLIVDGLDEIDASQASLLLSFLLDLARQHSKIFKLMVSSREYYAIRASMKNHPRITMNEENHNDIRLFVDAQQTTISQKYGLDLVEVKRLLEPLPEKSQGRE